MSFRLKNNQSIDDYLSGFNNENDVKLDNIRKEALREGSETGNIVYFYLTEQLGMDPEDQLTYDLGKSFYDMRHPPQKSYEQVLQEPEKPRKILNAANNRMDQIKFLNEAIHYKKRTVPIKEVEDIIIKYHPELESTIHSQDNTKTRSTLLHLITTYEENIYNR